VPLSEQEKRILEEIEKGLYKEDPRFARGVREKSPHFGERRRARMGVLVFIAGFVLLFTFFVSGLVLVGIAAFGVMVAGIILIAGALHTLVDKRSDVASARLSTRLGSTMRRWEERVKRRYKRL
jgi:hypothetical protein